MLDKIKINNIRLILVCLMSRRYATKAEIVEATGLSNSTVSSCVNSLLKLRLLVINGHEDSSGGRRSVIYCMNSDYGCFIGLNLKSDGISAVITDCNGQVLKSLFHKIDSPKVHIQTLLNLLGDMIRENQNVLGIGVGVSSQLDYEEQIIIDAPDLGWKHVHLKEIIEREYMIFTYLDHPINACAVYEGMLGCAQGQANYIYIGEHSQDKVALMLDHHLCRGLNNITGCIANLQLSSIVSSDMLQFLGISQLIIGYTTEEFKKLMMRSTHGFNGNIHCMKQTSDTNPLGIAVVTQRQWFGSIYFML